MLVEIWLVFHVKAGPEIQYNEPEKIEVFREKKTPKNLTKIDKIGKISRHKKYFLLVFS